MRRASVLALAGFMVFVCMASLVKSAPKEPFVGPILVPAQVVNVYDADTIYVDALSWPKELKGPGIRVAGVDTPEKRGTGCRKHPLWLGKKMPEYIKEYENSLGKAATKFVQERIKPGDWIAVRDVKPDKYHNRVVAAVHYAPDLATLQACMTFPYDFSACPSLGPELLRQDHAVKYGGKTKAAWWCEGPPIPVIPKAKPEGGGE